MIICGPFCQKVNPRLAKRPLKTNGRLANLGVTSLVKEARVNAKQMLAKSWIIYNFSLIVSRVIGIDALHSH